MRQEWGGRESKKERHYCQEAVVKSRAGDEEDCVSQRRDEHDGEELLEENGRDDSGDLCNERHVLHVGADVHLLKQPYGGNILAHVPSYSLSKVNHATGLPGGIEHVEAEFRRVVDCKLSVELLQQLATVGFPRHF